MTFKPIDKMMERVDIARDDSDTTLFHELMLLGEMLTKLVALGLIAAIQENTDRDRYKLLYRVVRADGIGDWTQTIDAIVDNAVSQHLMPPARQEAQELSQRVAKGTWQYEAVELIDNCLRLIEPTIDALSTRLPARRWFSTFATLRNKTRGHGALLSSVYSQICPELEQSIRLLIANFSLFQRSWAYIHRNLAGNYRITKLTDRADSFNPLRLKQDRPADPPYNGVYIHFDETEQLSYLAYVELLDSNSDASDFFFPNGDFKDATFEMISYITGTLSTGGAAPYLLPITDLPTSETQGIGVLDVIGNTFGNLPPAPTHYIHRHTLEHELYEVLINDRHPVVTLVGRGGIGKTSLALQTLYRVAEGERFEAILWFSARDIDLLPEGPKPVKPHVLTERDIAKEFVRLTEPSEAQVKGFDQLRYLAESLTKSSLGGPILFVFDNFETVRSTSELYAWIDTYIRLPNKVLITTRLREFKGDYPVEVIGMNEDESDALIDATATNLEISHLIIRTYRQDLYEESDGHPYVIKVLLGEVAKAGKPVKVERIVASRDEILDALFERTFEALSPAAKRVFMTLCSWRSTVPRLAVEAVLLRPANEKMDVAASIDELYQSSLLEVIEAKEDGELFLNVPLVASVFGQRKFAVSPMRSAIEADLQLLHAFGATQQSDLHRGMLPRVNRLFRSITTEISRGRATLEDYLPVIEFIARRYQSVWLLLADLYEDEGDLEKAKSAVTRYLEAPVPGSNTQTIWYRLAILAQQTNDPLVEIHALANMCQLSRIDYYLISNTANRIMHMLAIQDLTLDTDEKRVLVRRIAKVMERRMSEANATDLSRLAWLYVHLGQMDKARTITEQGLQLDQDNIYCQKLKDRLTEKPVKPKRSIAR